LGIPFHPHHFPNFLTLDLCGLSFLETKWNRTGQGVCADLYPSPPFDGPGPRFLPYTLSNYVVTFPVLAFLGTRQPTPFGKFRGVFCTDGYLSFFFFDARHDVNIIPNFLTTCGLPRFPPLYSMLTVSPVFNFLELFLWCPAWVSGQVPFFLHDSLTAPIVWNSVASCPLPRRFSRLCPEFPGPSWSTSPFRSPPPLISLAVVVTLPSPVAQGSPKLCFPSLWRYVMPARTSL